MFAFATKAILVFQQYLKRILRYPRSSRLMGFLVLFCPVTQFSACSFVIRPAVASLNNVRLQVFLLNNVHVGGFSLGMLSPLRIMFAKFIVSPVEWGLTVSNMIDLRNYYT
jgi:hypothetical protein